MSREERVAARMRKKAAWTDRVCGDGAGKHWLAIADLVEAGAKASALLRRGMSPAGHRSPEEIARDDFNDKLAALAKALGVEGE